MCNSNMKFAFYVGAANRVGLTFLSGTSIPYLWLPSPELLQNDTHISSLRRNLVIARSVVSRRAAAQRNSRKHLSREAIFKVNWGTRIVNFNSVSITQYKPPFGTFSLWTWKSLKHIIVLWEFLYVCIYEWSSSTDITFHKVGNVHNVSKTTNPWPDAS